MNINLHHFPLLTSCFTVLILNFPVPTRLAKFGLNIGK